MSASSLSKSSKFLILQFLVKCCKLHSVFKIPSKSHPRKHLLVLKTSSRHVLKKSWTRLQRNNFSSSRRLEDVLKTSCKYVLKTSWRCLEDISQDVLKTSWKTKNCSAVDVLKTSWRLVLNLKTSWRHVLKTSWRHVLKMSWRRLGDKQNFYWGYLYLTMA